MIWEAIPSPDMDANTYILQADNGDVLLVDAGDPNSPAYARAASLGPVRYVLLTHGHFDHILGAAEAKRLTGAPLVIHRDDAAKLADGDGNLCARLGLSYTPQTPDCTVADGDVLPFGDSGIEVLHTPGHTEGSVCYRVGDLLFSGDTLFFGTVGRTDFPGGNTETLMASLRRLAAIEDDLTVLPGHGSETSLRREKQDNPYMKRASHGTVCDW